MGRYGMGSYPLSGVSLSRLPGIESTLSECDRFVLKQHGITNILQSAADYEQGRIFECYGAEGANLSSHHDLPRGLGPSGRRFVRGGPVVLSLFSGNAFRPPDPFSFRSRPFHSLQGPCLPRALRGCLPGRDDPAARARLVPQDQRHASGPSPRDNHALGRDQYRLIGSGFLRGDRRRSRFEPYREPLTGLYHGRRRRDAGGRNLGGSHVCRPLPALPSLCHPGLQQNAE